LLFLSSLVDLSCIRQSASLWRSCPNSSSLLSSPRVKRIRRFVLYICRRFTRFCRTDASSILKLACSILIREPTKKAPSHTTRLVSIAAKTSTTRCFPRTLTIAHYFLIT
jgi:hypothetical protein